MMKTTTLHQEAEHEMKKAARRARKAEVPREDTEQMAFVEWARKHAELVWHTPNARRYSRGSWAYWKAMGVQEGIPDILMVCHGTHFALEFKRHGEAPTDHQRAALSLFRQRNWMCKVVHTAEDAKAFVRKHAPVWDGGEG